MGGTRTARLIIPSVLLLLVASCAQTMTLFPRGGGPQVSGTIDTVTQKMSIALDGETYTGEYIGAGRGSKQYSGLLVSPSGKTLRCEFAGALGETGNGVCQHGGGRTYDLQLKP